MSKKLSLNNGSLLKRKVIALIIDYMLLNSLSIKKVLAFLKSKKKTVYYLGVITLEKEIYLYPLPTWYPLLKELDIKEYNKNWFVISESIFKEIPIEFYGKPNSFHH